MQPCNMKIKEIIKQTLLVLVYPFRVLYEAVSGPEPDYGMWIAVILGLVGFIVCGVLLTVSIIREPMIVGAIATVIGVLFVLPYVLCKLINKIKKNIL